MLNQGSLANHRCTRSELSVPVAVPLRSTIKRFGRSLTGERVVERWTRVPALANLSLSSYTMRSKVCFSSDELWLVSITATQCLSSFRHNQQVIHRLSPGLLSLFGVCYVIVCHQRMRCPPRTHSTPELELSSRESHKNLRSLRKTIELYSHSTWLNVLDNRRACLWELNRTDRAKTFAALLSPKSIMNFVWHCHTLPEPTVEGLKAWECWKCCAVDCSNC